jgi:hypothetical protein
MRKLRRVEMKRSVFAAAVMLGMAMAPGAHAAERVYQVNAAPNDYAAMGDVGAVVTSMIGPKGRIVYNYTANLVVVSNVDNDTLIRVGDFIDRMNAALNRTVNVRVEVYEVITKEGADALHGIELLGSGAAGAFVVSHENAGSIEKLLRSNGVVVGKVSGLGSVLNNRVMPVKISHEQDYLSKITVADGVTEAVPYTVESGVFYTVQPRIVDNGGVLLSYSLAVSGINGDHLATNGNVMLNSGQNLVLPYSVSDGENGKALVFVLSAAEVTH